MNSAQYFVYTRNRDNDYKLVYAPDDAFCPADVRKFFLKQARGVINVESYSGTLDEPRWLVSRKGKYLLFGIGVMNRVLGTENNTDYTGTPVRGFFGMVVADGNDIRLPYDIRFFIDLYRMVVDPVWGCLREDFKFKGVYVKQDFDSYECLTAKDCDMCLNTSEQETSILPAGVKVQDVIKGILSLSADCSFVSGLNEKEHAFADEYCFMNATVTGVDERVDKSREKKEIPGRKMPSDAVEPELEERELRPLPPKKASRPKLMVLIGLLVVIILLMLGRACHGCVTSPDPLISGDTGQTETVAR